jgi:histidinol-phosphate/aromatic aminotransferase/cobyric acid decarboxylase-like protein
MFIVDEAFAAFGPPGVSLLELESGPPLNAVVVRC